MRPFKQAAILVVLSCTIWAQQEAVREAQVEPKAKPAMREAQTVQFKAPDMQTVKKILEEQKKAFGCNLTDQEMKTAAD